jgi:hypothetical protein
MENENSRGFAAQVHDLPCGDKTAAGAVRAPQTVWIAELRRGFRGAHEVHWLIFGRRWADAPTETSWGSARGA